MLSISSLRESTSLKCIRLGGTLGWFRCLVWRHGAYMGSASSATQTARQARPVAMPFHWHQCYHQEACLACIWSLWSAPTCFGDIEFVECVQVQCRLSGKTPGRLPSARAFQAAKWWLPMQPCMRTKEALAAWHVSMQLLSCYLWDTNDSAGIICFFLASMIGCTAFCGDMSGHTAIWWHQRAHCVVWWHPQVRSQWMRDRSIFPRQARDIYLIDGQSVPCCNGTCRSFWDRWSDEIVCSSPQRSPCLPLDLAWRRQENLEQSSYFF